MSGQGTFENLDAASPAGRTAPEIVGDRVLVEAVRLAAQLWRTRLVAAYALGSLAHGGFSVYVSDVDLALVLQSPLEARDAPAVGTLATTMMAGNLSLADRLSIFWGSPATLSGNATGGRFPPLDRLDLRRYGRLLQGEDIRAQVPAPSCRELIVGGAAYALQTLSSAQPTAELHDPQGLVAAGVRTLTKRILFPVRFLFTARTGEVGRNEDAVTSFSDLESGPAVFLVRHAFAWRTQPPDPHDPEAISMVAAGLLPLYRLFVEEYAARLREFGELELAGQLVEWRARLD